MSRSSSSMDRTWAAWASLSVAGAAATGTALYLHWRRRRDAEILLEQEKQREKQSGEDEVLRSSNRQDHERPTVQASRPPEDTSLTPGSSSEGITSPDHGPQSQEQLEMRRTLVLFGHSNSLSERLATIAAMALGTVGAKRSAGEDDDEVPLFNRVTRETVKLAPRTSDVPAVQLTRFDQVDLEDFAFFDQIVFVLATFDDGPPEPARVLCEQIGEAAVDHRFGSATLRHLGSGSSACSSSTARVLVVGLGDWNYGRELYCSEAVRLAENLKKLGATKLRLEKVDSASYLDDEESSSTTAPAEKEPTATPLERMERLVIQTVVQSLLSPTAAVNEDSVESREGANEEPSGCCQGGGGSSSGGGCCQSSSSSSGHKNSAAKSPSSASTTLPGTPDGQTVDKPGGETFSESETESEEYSDSDEGDSDAEMFGSGQNDAANKDPLFVQEDVEDFLTENAQSSCSSGTTVGAAKNGKQGDATAAAPVKKKKMLSTRQRENLAKEGYKVVGQHSAVKLCRWTKHHLRGRGGCYKHTFYGIASLSCMEATPSLACANKCVFCWRHHKNPVAKRWEWEMDEPKLIVENWLAEHAKMVKQLKGVPGVTPERFEQAKKIRHCALSLVGEPIMYPKINELLHLLHKEKISTFLVTNAQFPDELRALGPVTQLYLSIDAPTRETLKAVDRPLKEDFWSLFLDSIDALRETKFSRTVFRLTLVKNKNMDDTHDYAKLIKRGQPDFIEIKGVTYNGDGPGKDKMTMKSVPWHPEVVAFGKSILEYEGLSDDYELACEHEHSLIILLARKSFYDKEKHEWRTHIDYSRYIELVESGEWRTKTSLDYACSTPSWALSGSPEKGFDPKDTRVYRKKKDKSAAVGDLAEGTSANTGAAGGA